MALGSYIAWSQGLEARLNTMGRKLTLLSKVASKRLSAGVHRLIGQQQPPRHARAQSSCSAVGLLQKGGQ
jgi:hypothetical protein